MNVIKKPAVRVKPGSFDMENHYYTKVLNAQLHPMVSFFLNLSNDKIIQRYCHLNPMVEKFPLENVLNYKPSYIYWAGSDLFNVTTSAGARKMVIVETNSCPSGQKSMPLLNDHDEQGGYKVLMEKTFLPMMRKRGLPKGGIAVIYDKNPMENSGYAATIADLLKEDVFLVEFYDGDQDPSVRFTEGVMEVRDDEGNWNSIRIAFRYVTQKPWNRIPLHLKTLVLNPTIACLAGGRNKMVASKAYDMYNAELIGTGLSIITPDTINDVAKNEVPLWVNRFGGHAVVKIPYSNAGQGVYIITSQRELDSFMEADWSAPLKL